MGTELIRCWPRSRLAVVGLDRTRKNLGKVKTMRRILEKFDCCVLLKSWERSCCEDFFGQPDEWFSQQSAEKPAILSSFDIGDTMLYLLRQEEKLFVKVFSCGAEFEIYSISTLGASEFCSWAADQAATIADCSEVNSGRS